VTTATIGAGLRQSTLLGIALYAGAVFVLSVMDGLIKFVSESHPTAQVVFFRSTIGLFPIAVMLVRAGSLRPLQTRRLGLHLGRGLIAAIATFSLFYAFSALPLGDVYAIGFAAPLFVTAMSVPLLGEPVGWRRWAAVIVGFGGVLLMVLPRGASSDGLVSIGVAAALLGTAGYALSLVLMRRLGSTETNVAMVFYGGIVTTVLGVAGVFLGDLAPWLGWATPEGLDLVLLIVIGVIGGAGALMMAQAFRVATPSVLVPFEYTGMVWGVLIGWVVWHDVPTAWIWGGTGLVVASGLYILHRETLVSRRRPLTNPG
jgi:drug/metabolite transporter (DMT)-like permease